MSFWTAHGYLGGLFYIIFLLLLPRLTMFVSAVGSVGILVYLTAPFGFAHTPLGFPVGLLGIFVWVFFPRFLVAALATGLYFETNTVLCVEAWILAYVILDAKKGIAEERAKKRQKEQEEAIRDEAARVAAEKTAEQKRRTRGSDQQSGQQRRQRPTQSAGQRAQQWWDVLGVSPSASADAIKAAYRRMAKTTHPDSAPDGKGDVERFRKASEAYKAGLSRNGK